MASVPRYLARMVIPKLVKQGLSASAIIRDLRGRGLIYRRMSMLSDIRREVGIFKFGKAVVSLGSDVQIPKRIMVETDLLRARKYRVYGTAKYVNIETGRTTYEPVSFYDNTLRTKDQWSEEYISQKEEAKYREEVVCEGIEIFSVEHNKGFRY